MSTRPAPEWFPIGNMALDKKSAIEVHVAGICLRRRAGKIEALLLKRSSQKRIYPGLWECGGGQVQPGETFKEAIKREMREELRLKVEPLLAFDDYYIFTPYLEQRLIPGVKFICSIQTYVVKSDPREHTEFCWCKKSGLAKYKFIPGVKRDIKRAMELVEKLKLKI